LLVVLWKEFRAAHGILDQNVSFNREIEERFQASKLAIHSCWADLPFCLDPALFTSRAFELASPRDLEPLDLFLGDFVQQSIRKEPQERNAADPVAPVSTWMSSVLLLGPLQKIAHSGAEPRNWLALGDPNFTLCESGPESTHDIAGHTLVLDTSALPISPAIMNKFVPVHITPLEDAHFPFPFLPFIFRNRTEKELLAMVPPEYPHSFLFIVDRTAIEEPEFPVLVMDLFDEPGRTFRVIPHQIQGVQNNLSIANMDFYEFADNVDQDGVFRGFREP
jgi:hypothetical protein